MEVLAASEYTDDAAELPPGLSAAIERDTGLSAAQYLANAEAGDIARGVVDALAAVVDVRGSEMQGSELVVYVADAAAAAVVEQSGATAVIGEQVLPDYSDVVLNPAFELRGGEHYYYDGFRCTTGFVGTNLSAQTQILTAGHCSTGNTAFTRTQFRTQSSPFDFAPSNSPTVGGATALGPGLTGSFEVGSGYDHGLITIATPGNWTPLPQITTWNYGGGSNSQSPLTVRDARAPLVNEIACKSGATTGWTCGRITQTNVATCIGGAGDNPLTPDVNESRPCQEGVGGDYVLNGVWASICMRGGDSGGPVVVGTTAIGVNSASSAAGGPTGRCDSSDIGVFAPLYSSGSVTVNNPYGNRSAATKYPDTAWQVSIGVEQPTLSNTAGGVMRFTTTTLSGTIPFGSSRHGLIVEIDGTSTFTPTVSSTGQWSVNVGSLAPGRHTYELQATWGRSTSSVAAGSWLNASATRFAGANRYQTGAVISSATFPGRVQRVFVASGENFPDALAAGPIAAKAEAPLLLVPRFGAVPESVADELRRLEPDQIVVVGGDPSVSGAMEAALAEFASNPVSPTMRIQGQNRFETARLLAESAGFSQPEFVWVVSGLGFADALSVGSAAAARGEPLLLVPGTSTSVDQETLDLISQLDPDRIKIAGSNATVSSGIAAQLSTIKPVDRHGGSDRFETSWLIAQASGLDSTTVYIANGLNFPDALAGGVAAGVNGAPLVTSFPTCVPATTIDFLLAQNLSVVRILGGQPSISTAAANLTRC